MNHLNCSLRRTLATAGLLLAAAAPALADSGSLMPAKLLPAYSQECASCHIAFPPSLLPARSWQRLMSQLQQHYGTDASMDPDPTLAIKNWLQANAGTYKRVREEPPEDRITRAAWFERKHGKITAATWQLPSVKRAANCAACHTGAEQGEFDDDHLRMPAGLSASQRRVWSD